MASSAHQCPKCSRPMEQGFLIDSTDGAGGRVPTHWAPGPPRRSWWVGTTLPDGVLPVGTYRCSGCGYLESYARDEFVAG
jgi:hypothetical protein